MAADTEDTVDEDSRTATFERKRPHDPAAGDTNSNTGSAKSTPRKRARRERGVGHQDVRDFVPDGASFSSNIVPDSEVPGRGAEDTLEHLRGEPEGTVLCSDWNFYDEKDELAVNKGSHLYGGNLSGMDAEANTGNSLSGYSVYALPHSPKVPIRRMTNGNSDKTAIRKSAEADTETQIDWSGKTPGTTNNLDNSATDGAFNPYSDEGRRLHVGNLHYGAQKRHLREFFSGYPM